MVKLESIVFLIVVFNLMSSCTDPAVSKLAERYYYNKDTLSISFQDLQEDGKLEYIECLFTPYFEEQSIFVDVKFTPETFIDSIVQKRVKYIRAADYKLKGEANVGWQILAHAVLPPLIYMAASRHEPEDTSLVASARGIVGICAAIGEYWAIKQSMESISIVSYRADYDERESIETVKEWSTTHRGDNLLYVMSFDKQGDSTYYEYPTFKKIELKSFLNTLPEKAYDLSDPSSGIKEVKVHVQDDIFPEALNHYKRIGDLEGAMLLLDYLDDNNQEMYVNDYNRMVDSLTMELKLLELKKQEQNLKSELLQILKTKVNKPTENEEFENSFVISGKVASMLDRGTRYGNRRRDEVEVLLGYYSSQNAVLITHSIPFSNEGEYFQMRVTKQGEREYIRYNGFTVVVNVYEEVDKEKYNEYDNKGQQYKDYLANIDAKKKEIALIEEQIFEQILLIDSFDK